MKRLLIACLIVLGASACTATKSKVKEKIIGMDVMSSKYGNAYHYIYTESGGNSVSGETYYRYKVGDYYEVEKIDIKLGWD